MGRSALSILMLSVVEFGCSLSLVFVCPMLSSWMLNVVRLDAQSGLSSSRMVGATKLQARCFRAVSPAHSRHSAWGAPFRRSFCGDSARVLRNVEHKICPEDVRDERCAVNSCGVICDSPSPCVQFLRQSSNTGTSVLCFVSCFLSGGLRSSVAVTSRDGGTCGGDTHELVLQRIVTLQRKVEYLYLYVYYCTGHPSM